MKYGNCSDLEKKDFILICLGLPDFVPKIKWFLKKGHYF